MYMRVYANSVGIKSLQHPAQAERLRTFTGCRARTFALDEAGRATGRTARRTGTRRTVGTDNEPDGRRERHRLHRDADRRERGRRGAHGRDGQRAGRRRERATGGTETRTGANADGEGRTVAVLPDERTSKRTTGGTFGRRSDAGTGCPSVIGAAVAR